MPTKKILVGKILGPVGLRGELKLKLYSDDFMNIATKVKLTNSSGFELIIQSIKRTKDIFICTIANIDDRNKSEAFGRQELYCDKSLLPQLPDGEFYYSELMGLNVIDVNNNVVGIVANINNFGAGDLIEIKHIDGHKELYPFIQEFFPHITENAITFISPTYIESEDENGM